MADERPSGGLADQISDAVYVVDPTRRITYWNDAAERLTGYAACDVLGRRCGATLLAHVADDGSSLCGPRCPLDATIRDGKEREVHASLRTRAGDQLPVHIRASALLRDGAVVGAVEVFRDDTLVQEARSQIAALETLILQDALTGVGNRRALDAALEHQLAAARATGRAFGLIMLDLDGFKTINDQFGHGTGDVVLRHVASSVRAAVRPEDTVARLGGDELAVVTGPITAGALIRLNSRVRRYATRAPAATPHPVRVAVSSGSTLVVADDDALGALQRADAALYAHKARRPAPVAFRPVDRRIRDLS